MHARADRLSPEEDDVPLPDRRQDEEDSGASDGDDANPRNAETFTLAVTLAGTGAGIVTSTSVGVTCSGKTCTGHVRERNEGHARRFARGRAPSSSAWSGACAGNTACAPVLDGDVAVTANLEAIVGTWSGTYTNTRRNSGCEFKNAGNLSITIAADGTTFSTTGNIDGLELRQPNNGCRLVGKTTGTAPRETVTLGDAKTSGSWTFTVQNASEALAFPYTGTIAGNTWSGSWTCATCVGSFTLTKQ